MNKLHIEAPKISGTTILNVLDVATQCPRICASLALTILGRLCQTVYIISVTAVYIWSHLLPSFA
jgi:hypothetical protein